MIARPAMRSHPRVYLRSQRCSVGVAAVVNAAMAELRTADAEKYFYELL